MTYRKLIAYSPFLLSLVLVVGLLFTPNLVGAEEPDTVAGWLYDVVLNFFGWFAGWSAAFLNYAVNQFVIDFGGLVTGSGMGQAINSMWSIVRDFFNIVFIFAIIYLGFKMILGSDDSGTRRALVYLIIAALLVNFSLFISKFVVDFSNILASEVATAAFPAFQAAGGTPTAGTVDIGTNFFKMMRIPTSVQPQSTVINNTSSEWGYIFGIAMVYIIAIFAFTAGAVMLMIRYAALCIFMVLSPFMFIGWVLPQYGGLMRKYWSGFLGRAFFAPAYIVLLYFSGAVIQASFGSATATASDAGIGTALTGSGVAATASSFGAGLGPFILSAVFLIMSVQVAGKLSADGAGTAMRLGSNLANRGRRAAIATGRFGARNTAGYAAMGVGAVAERSRRRLNRGLSTMAQGEGKRGIVKKWGARTIDRTLGAGLDKTSRASIAGSETIEENRKRVRGQNARFNTTRQEADRSKETNADLTTIAELKAKKKSLKATGGKLSKADKQELAKARGRMSGNVGKMSNDEVLALSKKTLENKEFAQNMTEAHIKAVKESGIYTVKEGKGIAQANIDGTQDRFAEVLDSTTAGVDELNTTLDQLAQTMERMPTEKLLDLGGDKTDTKKAQWLLNERVAANLSEKQLEDLQNSGRFGAEQMKDIRDARERGLVNIATGLPTASATAGIVNSSNSNRGAVIDKRRAKLFQGSTKSAGQLPAAVYKEANMAMLITPAALAERDRNGLDTTEVTAIEANIKRLKTSTVKAEKDKYDKWKNWSKTSAGAQSRFNFE